VSPSVCVSASSGIAAASVGAGIVREGAVVKELRPAPRFCGVELALTFQGLFAADTSGGRNPTPARIAESTPGECSDTDCDNEELGPPAWGSLREGSKAACAVSWSTTSGFSGGTSAMWAAASVRPPGRLERSGASFELLASGVPRGEGESGFEYTFIAAVSIAAGCRVRRRANATSRAELSGMLFRLKRPEAGPFARRSGATTACNCTIQPAGTPRGRVGAPSPAGPMTGIIRIGVSGGASGAGINAARRPASVLLPLFSTFSFLAAPSALNVAPVRLDGRDATTSPVAVPLGSRSLLNNDENPALFCGESTGRGTGRAFASPVWFTAGCAMSIRGTVTS
jgi:hypothetical protein